MQKAHSLVPSLCRDLYYNAALKKKKKKMQAKDKKLQQSTSMNPKRNLFNMDTFITVQFKLLQF